jgi:ABC-type transport system substrate-binding protein
MISHVAPCSTPLRVYGILLIVLSVGCAQKTDRISYDDGALRRGGTLRLAGTSDVDRMLTTAAFTVPSLRFGRLIARQLTGYPQAATYDEQRTAVADLATSLPTRENGGVSADGLRYTFHLRRGVRWNSTPPREVVANDVVRAFTFMCNPVAPTPVRSMFSDIRGFDAYCDAFERVPPTVAAIRQFIESHALDGIRAADDTTVVFTLTRPMLDLFDVLATPLASPIPIEYLDLRPDDIEFRSRTISLGPYQIVAYVPGRRILMARNPVWIAANDPLRPAYVDSIDIQLGVAQPTIQQQLEAGTADLAFDAVVPPADVARLLSAHDERLMIEPPDVLPGAAYLAVNMVGGSKRNPLRSRAVRQAIGFAIDRAALAKIAGGSQMARPLRQAVASSVTGYRADRDFFITPADRGDSGRATALLAGSSQRTMPTLRLVHQVDDRRTALSIQAALRRIGVSIELVPKSFGEFYAYVMDPGAARRDDWQLALVGLVPDWYGVLNGRNIIQPFFDSRATGTNYGGYQNADVDRAIDRALGASSEGDAIAAWEDVVHLVTEDVPLIPLIEVRGASYRSLRVTRCIPHPASYFFCDWTSVALGPDRR